ncbi:hypothetical protein Tco_0676347 [Tanacetum coccineum]
MCNALLSSVTLPDKKMARSSCIVETDILQKDKKSSQNGTKSITKLEEHEESQSQSLEANQKKWISTKRQKTEPEKNDKTEHEDGKDCGKNMAKSKNVKVRVNTEESAVKPEPELKNTIGCNLNPSDGPGKPNSIIMKTVKTKWALNQLQQPICVQLTKTVKTLKAQS